MWFWAGLLADQLSKWWASTRPGWLSLNYGVAFGWGESLGGWTVVGVTIVVIVWLLLQPERRWFWQLLLAGAVSNLIDRVWWGGVRDWLPVPWLSRLPWLGLGLKNNLADWLIVIGVVGWVIIESRDQGLGNRGGN